MMNVVYVVEIAPCVGICTCVEPVKAGSGPVKAGSGPVKADSEPAKADELACEG